MKKFIPVCAIAILPAFLVQTTDSTSAQKTPLKSVITKPKLKSKSPELLNGYVDSLFLYRKYLDSLKTSNTTKVKELEKINTELKKQDSVLEVLTTKSKKDDLY